MSKLSKTVIALVVSGASATAITGAFLIEKEGVRYQAYLDGKGIPTLCLGHTKGVRLGDTATAEQCAKWANEEIGGAIARVEQLTPVPLSEPAKAAIASFCFYNLGESKCKKNKDGSYTQFWQKWQKGDIPGACQAIRSWIYDGGKDCRIRANNCYGQVLRRDQEVELCLSK